MLIRQQQMDKLAAAYQEIFLKRAVAHLRTNYPEKTATLTEAALAEEILYGIERAKVYDIDTQRDVTKYLNLMFEFGRNFDIDPNCGWAHAILVDSRPRKMERLRDAGLAVLIGGADGKC